MSQAISSTGTCSYREAVSTAGLMRVGWVWSCMYKILLLFNLWVGVLQLHQVTSYRHLNIIWHPGFRHNNNLKWKRKEQQILEKETSTACASGQTVRLGTTGILVTLEREREKDSEGEERTVSRGCRRTERRDPVKDGDKTTNITRRFCRLFSSLDLPSSSTTPFHPIHY